MQGPMDDDQLRRTVGSFLHKWKTASLATVGEKGRPHSCNIFFASDDLLRFFFVSSPQSSHSQYMLHNAHVSGAVYAHVRLPNRVHGLQYHGRCAVVNDADLREIAWRCYSRKYPFVLAPPLRKRFESEQFYMIEPTWLRFTDNRRGFGWKQEVKWVETALESQGD